jgi:hypothetical protein
VLITPKLENKISASIYLSFNNTNAIIAIKIVAYVPVNKIANFDTP